MGKSTDSRLCTPTAAPKNEHLLWGAPSQKIEASCPCSGLIPERRNDSSSHFTSCHMTSWDSFLDVYNKLTQRPSNCNNSASRQLRAPAGCLETNTLLMNNSPSSSWLFPFLFPLKHLICVNGTKKKKGLSNEFSQWAMEKIVDIGSFCLSAHPTRSCFLGELPIPFSTRGVTVGPPCQHRTIAPQEGTPAGLNNSSFLLTTQRGWSRVGTGPKAKQWKPLHPDF